MEILRWRRVLRQTPVGLCTSSEEVPDAWSLSPSEPIFRFSCTIGPRSSTGESEVQQMSSSDDVTAIKTGISLLHQKISNKSPKNGLCRNHKKRLCNLGTQRYTDVLLDCPDSLDPGPSLWAGVQRDAQQVF
ncbi:hypothetical protein EYF80_042259 [Liparis tanakae]|uniref:Uncharacterized protein n=1 Tax=Liparis tanakae TaxID=230148 RepID=A0A4Z2G1V7_9TELE|nr:hypothetical protein EYF80_042259 [Liparis tanakae]